LITLKGKFATAVPQRELQSDKIWHHGYYRFYPRFIEPFCNIQFNWAMLEIGIDQSKSLSLWKNYFGDKCFIFGIDIDISAETDFYKIFKADQSNKQQLISVSKQIKQSKRPICFIIDDGSHIPEHQLLTFNLFFIDLLEYGGTYIIEDIETSYWSKGSLYGYPTQYGLHHKKSIIEAFKPLVDDINSEFLSEQAKQIQFETINNQFPPNVRSLIGTITFGQNCIIITKKTKEDIRLYNDREYRFRKNL
jgi:hypothetical protein